MKRRFFLGLVAPAIAACGLSVTGIDPEGMTMPGADDARAAASEGIDAARDGSSTATDESSVTPPTDAGTEVDANNPVAASLFGEDCPAGTVYEDDFSTDPAGRWIAIAGTWEWDAAQHTYSLKPLLADGTHDVGIAWIGPRPKWTNYDVDVMEHVSLPPNDHGDVGPVFRVVDIPKKDPQPADDGNMFLAAAQVNTSTNLILAKFQDGVFTSLSSNNNGYDTTKSITVHAKIAGAAMKAWLNDDSANSITATNNTYTNGSIGIRSFKSPVVLSHVTVTCR